MPARPIAVACVRPVWVDDRNFLFEQHVGLSNCDPAGGLPSALELAAELVTTPLRKDRPLWAARLVLGKDGASSFLIVVFHHVLADGVASLSVLQALTDDAPDPPPGTFPSAAPTVRRLFVDAFAERIGAARLMPTALKRLGRGRAALMPAVRSHAARYSINSPTGRRRVFSTVRCSLPQVNGLGLAHGATVNDVALSVVAGGMGSLLLARGEHPGELLVSVPVSSHRTAMTGELGNRSGVVVVVIPMSGNPFNRLRAIARITTAAKAHERGVSAVLLGPAFRLLARIGLFRFFIDRQRLKLGIPTELPGSEPTAERERY